MSTDDERAWLTEEEADTSADSTVPRFQQVGLTGVTPIEPVRQERRRPSWLGPAVAAIVLVLIVSVAGVWGLSSIGAGVDPARAGYGYLPTGTAAVIEARLDLPAGQREELGSFLSRFPGFANASTVETLLVERLDDLVRSTSQGRANYRDDVQSFFSGWVVAGVSARMEFMPTAGQPLVLLGVSDRPAAETAMLKLRSPDMTWTVEDVDGVQLWVGRYSGNVLGGLSTGGNQVYAVTDDVLILGWTSADIKRALDTHAGKNESMLDDQRFTDALKRAPAGRLGLTWFDIDGFGDLMTGLALPSQSPTGPCADVGSAAPTDGLGVLYLRDGRAVVEVSYSRPAGATALDMRASSLDVHVPTDTFLYAEARSIGDTYSKALACLRDNVALGDQLADLERSLGPIEDLISWMGDAAIAVRYDGTKLTAGLLVAVDDEIAASEALGQLRAALTTLGNEAGSVTVREEAYRDARLVTFDFSGAGLSSLPPVMPSTSLAYALKDGLLVIGIDSSFARAVLDTEQPTSLAGKDNYRRALEFGGAAQNAGVAYLDVPTALDVIDDVSGSMPGGAGGLVQIRQYLAPLDDATIVTLDSGGSITIRIALNTRELP